MPNTNLACKVSHFENFCFYFINENKHKERLQNYKENETYGLFLLVEFQGAFHYNFFNISLIPISTKPPSLLFIDISS